jgi:very-short-patch-repair endonuclease
VTDRLFHGDNHPRNGEVAAARRSRADDGGGPLHQPSAGPPPRSGEELGPCEPPARLLSGNDPPRYGEGDHPQDGGGAPAVLRSPIKQVKRARELRRNMSLPEILLWQQLRRRPGGYKFRRQFPVVGLTTDFACLERRLVIEVDGEGHSFGDRPRRDAARDALLFRAGFAVLRIPARDVLGDLDAVVRWIVASCTEESPPRNGEVAAARLRADDGGGPPFPGNNPPRTGVVAAARPCRADDGGGPLHQPSAGPPPRSGEEL